MEFRKTIANIAVIATTFAGTSASAANQVSYQVHAKTADVDEAGTDARVRIRLNGTKGSSPYVNLDNSADNFERDSYDTFDVFLPDLGELTSLDLEYTRGSGRHASWRLEYIKIISPSGITFFPFYNWLSQDGTWRLNATPE